ncbi:MAG: carboxypeptidase regulatory-like domain-containing protein [Candidatus Sulfotelmatobacter sp.]
MERVPLAADGLTLTPALLPRYPSAMGLPNIKTGLLCAILLTYISLYAQQPTQVPVTIHVTDQSGAVVAHAQIRIAPAMENLEAKLETDSHGQFSINLSPGSYSLSVSAPGFKKESLRVEVGAGEPRAGLVISVVLQVAAQDGMVVSSADALLLSSDQHHASAVSPADFRALPHVTLKVHNGHTNADETYSGVPLATLLARIDAPMGSDLRAKAMTSYLVATGSDGYSVVLSVAEVDPGFRDSQAIVADSRDGQPLGKNGPFQLIVPGDKRPARWVHNLVSITLQHAH